MDRFKSRKFWLTVATALLLACNQRLGLGLDEDTVLGIAGLVVAYLAAQGWVDGRGSRSPEEDIAPETPHVP